VGRIPERARHHDAPGLALRPHAGQMCFAVGPSPLQHVGNVVVQEKVMNGLIAHAGTRYALPRYAAGVANLEKRGSYTPRRVREQRAYRLLLAGGVTGTIGVVGLVLAVVGVVGAGWPIIALIVAAICLVLFRRTVGS
jgi:hypothetical protein